MESVKKRRGRNYRPRAPPDVSASEFPLDDRRLRNWHTARVLAAPNEPVDLEFYPAAGYERAMSGRRFTVNASSGHLVRNGRARARCGPENSTARRNDALTASITPPLSLPSAPLLYWSSPPARRISAKSHFSSQAIRSRRSSIRLVSPRFYRRRFGKAARRNAREACLKRVARPSIARVNFIFTTTLFNSFLARDLCDIASLSLSLS